MKNPRMFILAIILIMLFISACGLSTPTAAEPTIDLAATNQALSIKATIQQGIIATQNALNQEPTPTKPPTAVPPTRAPTPTFEPAPELNAVTLEKVLRAEGYKRYPFQDSTGDTAYYWDNGSDIFFNTYTDGFTFGFLNDSTNLPGRLKLIDRALKIINPLLSNQANEELRSKLLDYADRVTSVSGDSTIIDYGHPPDVGKLMEFNSDKTSIRDGAYTLPVRTRLLFRQYQCDVTLYYYCYFWDMPTMTFSGDASLTMFDVWINYPSEKNSGSTG
jgi:hypothetical protein